MICINVVSCVIGRELIDENVLGRSSKVYGMTYLWSDLLDLFNKKKFRFFLKLINLNRSGLGL